MILERIGRACRADCQLDPARRLVVGVSGGPDSLCLLAALVELGYPVIAACFDHALRAESAQETELVAGLAERMGVPFVTAREDVAGLAERERLSLEEAARTARYRFLFAQARLLDAQAVAVGHTADDQVETVLMHFLRGAGLGGLKGMPYRGVVRAWDDRLPVVRPLLGVWHAETVAFCRERELPAVNDATNMDPTFYRNRLRHELIPYLQTYNPQVKEVIARTAQTLAADYQVLESAAQTAWESCAVETGPGAVSLSLAVFRELQPGLRRAVLRRAVAFLRPALRDVDFATIERGEAFACRPSRTGQIDLAQGLRLSIDSDRLVLSEWSTAPDLSAYPQMSSRAPLGLPVPGQVELLDGWRLRAEIVSGAGLLSQPAEPRHAWLDASTVTLPLTVRCARPGERFQPLGMGGHSLKLSDFWINRRVPRAARAAWPLVFCGDTLAWVPLHGPAHPFRLVEHTRERIHLWVDREE